MAVTTACGSRRLDLPVSSPGPVGGHVMSVIHPFNLKYKGGGPDRCCRLMASRRPSSSTVMTKPDKLTVTSDNQSVQPSAPLSSSSTVVASPAAAPRDPRRLAVFAAALTATAELVFTWISGQSELPSLEDFAVLASAAGAFVATGVPAGLLLAKALMRDRFHVELHRGRLYICAGVPSAGPPLEPGAVQVRPTGDVRGNGAYAAAPIPGGTHVIDYEGDLLDRAAFQSRYPDGVGNYAMALDDEYVIDAATRAPHTDSFHAVHMNHSRTRANVRRYYKRSEGRISFFALRDIEPGEELLYDYGRAYWYGREHLELP